MTDAFVLPLISWYRENRKSMPWREDPTPYHVWISEIMLQQTRIEAAIPYYERFLKALPDVQALAAVSEEDLLKLWEGLGYYSRARNLKKAAMVIMERFGGVIPDDAESLRNLPGIGDYTAGAIASIAYGKPEPAVDGNVLRVMMRYTACNEDILEEKTRRRVRQELKEIYPAGQDAQRLTEALMELGEVICLPNTVPQCERCPLKALCEGKKQNRAAELPVRLVKTKKRTEEKTVLRLLAGGRMALRKRADTGLLAGLWELPNLPGHLTENEVRDALAAQGLNVLSAVPLGEGKHVFTHVTWLMTGYEVTLADPTGEYTWIDPARLTDAYAVPTAFRRFLPKISENGETKK